MQPISTVFFRKLPCPNNSLQPTHSAVGLLMKKEQREEKSSQADQQKIKPQLII